MAPEPFLTMQVRSCRDLLVARHRARQIAQLLRFSPQDIICIAAGTFVVAEQAKKLLRRAEVCFALIERQLRVYARPVRPLVQLTGDLYILSKPLPQDDHQLAAEDIAWLVKQVGERAPTSLRDEILRQTQEVLVLLRALRGV